MTRASPDQDAVVWPATVFAATLIAQQVAAKATRDALFLSTIGVAGLPTMLIGAGVASLVLVPVSSRIMSVLGPARLVPAAFVASGLLLAGEWLFAGWLPRLVAVLFYLQVATLNAILISWFWSMMSERFNPRAARQKMQRLVAGAAFGGLVGGLLAERIAVYFGVARMPAVLGMLHLVCAALAWRLRPAEVAARPSAPQPPAVATEGPPIEAAAPPRATRWGFQVLLRSRYARDLAALVLLGTLTATLLDYVFKLEAVATYTRGPALLRFFAVFYAAVGLLTFIVQAGLSRLFLTHFGLARTVATLPAAVATSSLGALFVPGLASVALARGAEATLRNSLYRSGYEIFYTPIPPNDKRAVKTIIDVGCDRQGDVLGGAIIQAMLLVMAPSSARIGLLGIAVVLALVLLLLTARLHPGYVHSLERSLLDRAVQLDLADIGDSTTLSVATAVGLPVLSSSTKAKETGTPVPSPEPLKARSQPAAVADPVVERISALRSGDSHRATTALNEGPISRELAAPAIALMAWDEVAPLAVQALSAVVGSIIGQLSDALLSPDEEFAIRRRVARVLSASDDPRAVDALLFGLKDARFEVRYRCGRSLAAIRDRNPTLAIDRDRVFAAVLREAKVDKGVWESHRLLDQFGESDDSLFVDEFLRDRASRSLEHVFTLLSLVLARQPLTVAFHGLYTNDEALRGTALEYLEGVLPTEIREPLWPFLEDRRPRERIERPREDVLAELLLSNKSIQLNLDQLRRAARSSTP
jgi:ATP/ADP translocase/HEAT repeat protein